MRSTRSACRAGLLAAAVLFGALEGRAQSVAPLAPPDPSIAPMPDDTDQARDAFRQGSVLAKQGRWADALLAFRESSRLKPHPVTTYNVAYCERALGHDVRAAIGFAAALEPAATPGGPALSPQLADRAETYLDDARRRIAHVNVTLRDLASSLRVDGLPLEPNPGDATAFVAGSAGSNQSAPLPARFSLWLDAGTHVFVVTDPHGAQVVESRVLVAGSTSALALPGESGAPAAVTPPSPAATQPDVAARGARNPSRVPAYVAWGIGGAGLVAGGVFGILALHEQHTLDSDPRCAGKSCPDEPHYRDTEARFGRYSDFATAGLCLGIAGAAVGAVLWLTSKPGTPEKAGIGFSVEGVEGRF